MPADRAAFIVAEPATAESVAKLDSRKFVASGDEVVAALACERVS